MMILSLNIHLLEVRDETNFVLLTSQRRRRGLIIFIHRTPTLPG